METQEDSIDIANVQRVALGKDNDQSHSVLGELHIIPQPPNNQSHSLAGREDLPKSPLDPLRNNPSQQNDTTAPIDAKVKRSDTELKRINGKMSSAESAPADTQVVSQSVFDNLIRQNHEEDANTLRTLHEGESGHIDLLAGFENGTQFGAGDTQDNENENEDHGEGDGGTSSPLEYQPNFFPESQRFVTKTPAMAVKVNRVEDGSNESPSVSWNPLASEAKSVGGTMGLSQIFESTQIPSSPLVNRHQQSDNQLSDRPSPNLPIQRHPLSTMESPTTKLAATFPQDSSEPSLHCISMKESQAERERIQNERRARSAEYIHSDGQSDEEFYQEPSFVERIKRRKRIERESREQFAGLSAPARSGAPNRARRKGNSSKDQETRNQTSVTEQPLQTGTVSEEETEQEDESYQSVPRSQQPNSSTEEDKENYIDESALAATASAHDRLSQALALDGSQTTQHNAPRERADYRQRPYSPNPEEQADRVGQSSQTYIVKDSQQSPVRDNGNKAQHEDNGQWHPDNIQGTLTQQQAAPLQTERPVQSSSPPPVPQQDPPSLPHHNINHNNDTISRNRSVSTSSHEYPSQIPKTSSAPEGIRTQSSISASQNAANGEKVPTVEPRDKSSSMPSHVAETPVNQHPRSFGDTMREAVPETDADRRWNGDTNGDTIAQEDDDILPVYSGGHDRASQSGHPNPATVKSDLNPKILSSPSGRKRRKLTDIASDDTSETSYNIDLNIGILTADDKEFASVVARTSPPRKRRRKSEYRINPSDTVQPIISRPVTPRATHVQVQEPISEEPQPEKVSENTGTKSHRLSKTPELAISIWDVENSPQRKPSRRGRPRNSISRYQQSAQAQETENDLLVPPVIMNNHDSLANGGNTSHSAGESKSTTSEEHPTYIVPVPPDGVQIAHNQVLAPWTGSKRAYYPATCLGTPFGSSESRYMVKFEDSPTIDVPMSSVKRLEFRMGDAVKVDMPDVPRVTHIVRGFGDKVSEEALVDSINKGLFPMTDVYGHSTLILGPKQRKSLPNGGVPGPESMIRAPISRVYLDTILWNQLKDRMFTYNGSMKPENRSQTPSDWPSTPTTPSTRLSRSIRYMGGLFAGMIFAVSYVDDETGKSRVSRLLLENDGRVVDGFNELFDFSSSVPLATPTKQQNPSSMPNKPSLRPTSSAEEIGFACVIADKHSRREKYMQALALNLPCISGRWVEDCVAQNRIVDWDMYLLPAGDSMYLNGAAKSRILTPSPATNARFSQTIGSRPNLLREQSVLLVMGRGKEEEKSRAYIFLMYALGAGRVERVYDLKAAKSILVKEGPENCSWDWVYVHGLDQHAVKAAFLGTGSGALSASAPNPGRGMKKRKASRDMGCINGQYLGLSSKVTVVGNDFVCQSLILGKLMA